MHHGTTISDMRFPVFLISLFFFNNKVEKELIGTKFLGVICDCWILPLFIQGHIYNHWQSVSVLMLVWYKNVTK